jgi:hypothetical protein
MTNRPSVPEIITVNSEDLQAQIRDLLPSQNGFGSELQATNVITPIIDLTAAAEGSGLPTYLQTALAFGSATVFDADGSTVTLTSNTGFFRVVGSANFSNNGANTPAIVFNINDGSADKQVWSCQREAASPIDYFTLTYDLTFFLRAGDTLSVIADANSRARGSFRQVATGDGTLVQPVGFPL